MNIHTVFNPNSIALIGASRDPNSVGGSLLQNLLQSNYKGSVYPVNPKATEIMGVSVYPTVSSIQKPVDLAIVAIPSKGVLSVIQEAIEAQIKAVVVISAGFKEQGEEGKKREEELVKLCNTHDLTLVGPNCLGILNAHIELNASFETVLPIKGNIACISQSGALISSLLDIANDRGIGFSKIISVGNKAQITENELLPYFFQDPETSVITLYTESLHNANELLSMIHENQRSDHPKPVIMLKAGVTQEGQHASSSHTGSLAGSDFAYQTLVNQAGIIRVRSMDELLTTAHVCANNPLPNGNKVTIVTNAGGPGILATDEASRLSLSLSHFTQTTISQLTTILPSNSHPVNPVDLLGDANSTRYEQALSIIAKDPEVDSIVTIVTPQSMTDVPETAAAIIRARNSINKPVVSSFIGDKQIDKGQFLLSATGVAHSQFPEPTVTALGHLTAFASTVKKRKNSEYAVFRSIDTTQISLPQVKSNTLLDTETVFKLLQKAEVPVVTSVLAQSERDIEEKSKQFHGEIAMKIVSPDISHKTDVGGVKLHVKPEQAMQEFKEMMERIRTHAPQARTDGVLLSEMIEGEGEEFYIGMKREEPLGTLILVGLGGIYVELLKDISGNFAPITTIQAKEMIFSLQGSPLLTGIRNKPLLDIDAFCSVLVNVANLALSVPSIKELDINPIIIRPKGQGVIVLDARMIMS